MSGGNERRPRHLVARRFGHRKAFPRHRGLIQRARAFDDLAVHGNALARAKDDPIARAQVRSRHPLFDARVRKPHRGVGHKLHEACDGLRGFSFRSRFKVFAHRDEGEDHRRGVKVEVGGVVLGHGEIAARDLRNHAVERKDPERKRRPRADRDERVHVGRAVQKALHAVHKELAIEKDDRHGQ